MHAHVHTMSVSTRVAGPGGNPTGPLAGMHCYVTEQGPVGVSLCRNAVRSAGGRCQFAPTRETAVLVAFGASERLDAALAAAHALNPQCTTAVTLGWFESCVRNGRMMPFDGFVVARV